MDSTVATTTKHVTEEDVDKLLSRIREKDSAVIEELCADNFSIPISLLSSLEEAEPWSPMRTKCSRCLVASAVVCPTSLVRSLAEAGALTRWVYVSLGDGDATCAMLAVEFLGVMCAAAQPPLLTGSVRDKLGRNLVRLLIDLALETRDAEPASDRKLPPTCKSALSALMAVYSQIVPMPVPGGASPEGEATDLSLNRALEVILAHPRTEDGVFGQLLISYANRYIEEEPWGTLTCHFLSDVFRRRGVSRAVFYEQDIKILANVLTRTLEDLPLVTPDPARIRIVGVLSRVFADRLVRMSFVTETAYAIKTLKHVESNSPDDETRSIARTVLAMMSS